MSKLILSAAIFLSTLTHAAIVESGQRLSAEDFAAQQAGCTLQSPEMLLAKACYSGADMDVNSNAKFVGTVGADDRLRYCYNALVIPTKVGLRTQMQVLRDNESGQLRVQNFNVPLAGKSMIAAGVEGHCLTAAKIDGLSCGANPSLAIDYAEGGALKLDSAPPGAKGTKVTAENGNQDLTEISKTLVTDIDRRLDLASNALISESKTVHTPTAMGVLKRKAKSLQECATAANDYRASHKLIKADAEADAQRRQIVDAAKRIEAGQPAAAPGAPASSGSSR